MSTEKGAPDETLQTEYLLTTENWNLAATEYEHMEIFEPNLFSLPPFFLS